MAKRIKWTAEEDEILVQAIKANPHNRQEAFKQAVAKLETRDVKSCANRWYGILSNPKNKAYVGCVFTMIGVSSRLDNRTSNVENAHITPIKSTKTIWSKIKKLLGL